MSVCINPIVIRLPNLLKDKYDIPANQGIFITGVTPEPDKLILKVLPEDYNAANPVNLEVKLGILAPYQEITRNFYRIEAVDRDRRSAVKRYVLRDLLIAGGNLRTYGIAIAEEAIAPKPCYYPLVAIEDYHELDSSEDEARGFTIRVGTLAVESLKGSYRQSHFEATNTNYNQGVRIIFTHTHSIIESALQVYLPRF